MLNAAELAKSMQVIAWRRVVMICYSGADCDGCSEQRDFPLMSVVVTNELQ